MKYNLWINCSSTIRRVPNQKLQARLKCLTIGSTVHEIGHTIGRYHEHSFHYWYPFRCQEAITNCVGVLSLWPGGLSPIVLVLGGVYVAWRAITNFVGVQILERSTTLCCKCLWRWGHWVWVVLMPFCILLCNHGHPLQSWSSPFSAVMVTLLCIYCHPSLHTWSPSSVFTPTLRARYNWSAVTSRPTGRCRGTWT